MPEAPSTVAVVGFGGFGRELVSLITSGRTSPVWGLTAILDDNVRHHGAQYGGVTVSGPADAAADLDAAIVIAVGSPRNRDLRQLIAGRLALPDQRYATIIAADAYVGTNCHVGRGSTLMPNVTCTADVTIGRHTNVMPNCTLTHDVRVGDFVAIGAGAQLAGGTTVGDGAYLGSGVLVREGVHVGAGALLGMGSVVLDDVPEGAVWAGSPAQRLR